MKILQLFCGSVFLLFLSGFIPQPKFNPGKEFALIPSGTVATPGDNAKTIQSFYIQRTEVTNRQYREFLDDLLAKGKKADYERAKVDSTGWLKYSGYLAANYHRLEKYNDYPVVNISREGALLYCQWLSEKLNVGSGAAAPVRLPTLSEWKFAAMGGKADTPTPWGWQGFCNTKGYYLANFAVDSAAREMCMAARKTAGQDVHVAKKYRLGNIAPEEREMFTSPSVSYWANGYGLYNICGNAAEMVSEEGRTTAGGSWQTGGKFLWIQSQFDAYENIMVASPGIGFRPVITFSGKK